MREWQIGDPVDGTTDGWMDAQNWGHGQDDEKDKDTPSRNRRSNPKRDKYSKRAWDLYQDFKEEEALKYINMALDLDSKSANNWNRKAIILEALERYPESEECYIKSNQMEYSPIVCDNRARMLYRWASSSLKMQKNHMIRSGYWKMQKASAQERCNPFRAIKARKRLISISSYMTRSIITWNMRGNT